MTMRYVRERYGVPIGRWRVVRQIDGNDDELIIMSCRNGYVCARHPFSPVVKRFHPLDLEYLTNDGWVRGREMTQFPCPVP